MFVVFLSVLEFWVVFRVLVVSELGFLSFFLELLFEICFYLDVCFVFYVLLCVCYVLCDFVYDCVIWRLCVLCCVCVFYLVVEEKNFDWLVVCIVLEEYLFCWVEDGCWVEYFCLVDGYLVVVDLVLLF